MKITMIISVAPTYQDAVIKEILELTEKLYGKAGVEIKW